MRTPKEFRDNLDSGIITATMLSAALHSVNKRAKNYRDHERLDKRLYGWDSKYTASQREKKEAFYRKKERLLSVLSPICVHQEFAGHKRERIYSYEPEYEEAYFLAWLNGCIVWENCYWDYEQDDEVCFFDRISPDKPLYRYYLYYCVGAQTFHTPIDRPERYPDLPVKKIGTLDTTGEQATDLLSVQFVDKMLQLIKSGNFQYQEDVAPTPPEYPEYPEPEIETLCESRKPSWRSVRACIRNDLAYICQSELASKLSPELKSSFCTEQTLFHFVRQKKSHRKKKRSGKAKEADVMCEKPCVGFTQVELDDALKMTPELDAYLAALDTRDISRWEYLQYFVKPESPIYEQLLNVAKEYVRRENTKNCLCAIVDELYEREARKIELNEVWEIFLERYSNSEESIQKTA